MTTGELIREARKKKGLTQRELGDLLGMSDVGVAQWEKGLRNPRLETRQRIAKVLDIDITMLMSDSEKADYFNLFGTEQERVQLALTEIKNGIVSKTKKVQEYGGIATQEKKRGWAFDMAHEMADKFYVPVDSILEEICLDTIPELAPGEAPSKTNEILALLDMLNADGYEAVLRHIRELVQIPAYKKV